MKPRGAQGRAPWAHTQRKIGPLRALAHGAPGALGPYLLNLPLAKPVISQFPMHPDRYEASMFSELTEGPYFVIGLMLA